MKNPQLRNIFPFPTLNNFCSFLSPPCWQATELTIWQSCVFEFEQISMTFFSSSSSSFASSVNDFPFLPSPLLLAAAEGETETLEPSRPRETELEIRSSCGLKSSSLAMMRFPSVCWVPVSMGFQSFSCDSTVWRAATESSKSRVAAAGDSAPEKRV